MPDGPAPPADSNAAADQRPAPTAAAFFDLDKTVIATSSALVLSRPLYSEGLITRRAALRSAYARFVFQIGGADHDQNERLRQHLSRMVTGWDVQQVSEIVAETLNQLIEPLVYTEATALMAAHRAAGREIVIVSASGAEVVNPIGELLGADRVIATEMAVADGRYTGEIGRYVYAGEKAAAIRQTAAECGYDLAECFAYTDSITDIPMLEAVGHPNVVNPDKALRREALARGWPVLDFTHPVPLRSRMAGHVSRLPTPSRPMLVVALGAGAATAGLVWALRARRHSVPA